MKKIFIALTLLTATICRAQEPGYTGFKFRLLDGKGNIVTGKTIKDDKIKILFRPFSSDFLCKQVMGMLSLNIGEKPSKGLYLPCSFSDSLNCFTFSTWLAPTVSCDPVFIIVQGKDTMFLHMKEINNCIYRKYDPKRDHCKPFIINFKKGYYYDNKLAVQSERAYIVEYFDKERAKNFCNWDEIN